MHTRSNISTRSATCRTSRTSCTRSAALQLAAVLMALVWAAASLAGELPRVITLAPHLTELAYQAGGGDRLVGVVDYSDYPPHAEELPIIGDAFRLDLEAILEIDPDLALAWRGGTPASAAERLETLGIEIVWIETRTLEDIGTALETVGERVGNSGKARQAAERYRERLQAIEGPDLSEPVTIFYQVSARPLFTLGRRHVINEVFRTCGARNLFSDLDSEAASVDTEAVIAGEPDIIIAGREEGSDQDPLENWRNSSLVENGDTLLHTVDPALLVRPTPRIIDGIEHVCDLVRETAHGSATNP